MKSILLLLLSIAGMFVAAYFALVFYGVMRPDTPLVPKFCRLGEQSCSLIIHHPDACLFGIPNALLAIGYYLAVMVYVTAGHPAPLTQPLMYASWLTVAVAAYLVYSLAFRIKILCPMCLVGHGINIVISLLLTVGG